MHGRSNRFHDSTNVKQIKKMKWRVWSSYFVHQRDDLKDELILPQVVSVFEDDWVHGSILSLEDQLGRHQSTLTDRGGGMNETSHDQLREHDRGAPPNILQLQRR